MTQPHSRHLSLEGSFNLRNLGGYTTQQGQTTRWGQLFRADSPHRWSLEGQRQLLEQGLRTVIDLRGSAELQAAPNPFATQPGVNYVHISLFEPLYLSGTLGGGNRLGLELPELYRLALQQSQPAFKETLEVIARTKGPVLFHCTVGKDRTGLVAALVLGAVGVEADSIVQDYAATADFASGLLERLRQEAAARGHDLNRYNRLLGSEPAFMRNTLEYLEQTYGGVGAYLDSIGLQADWLAQLRQKLL